MMKGQKKGFKLPKYLMDKTNSLQQEFDNGSNELNKAEDYYDLAVSEEDSGDRWFTSDLSKAIRFYHRAHENYKTSLRMQPDFVDALFNLPRLEFEVYNKYIKDDSVVLNDLENCADALNDCEEGGLFQNLVSICKTFETCIDVALKSNANINWDFYYNLALAYFEYIEVLCSDVSNLNNIVELPNSEIIVSLQRSVYWFEHVFRFFETNSDDSFILENVVQVICDSYNLISTINESMNNQQSLNVVNSITEPLLVMIDKLASEISSRDIPQTLMIDLNIAKLSQLSSMLFDFQELVKCWGSQNDLLNISLEKKLLEGSSYRSFLDKFESTATPLSDDAKWAILSHMSTFYRGIYETLRDEIAKIEGSKRSDNDILSSKICLLCSVTIERGDIELERSLLNTEFASNNKLQLQTNTRNILKNAIIFSKKSGGLKESAAAKLARAKRQREAVMRLCLLDGKSQEEWGIILGNKYWPIELESLGEIEAYKRLFS